MPFLRPPYTNILQFQDTLIQQKVIFRTPLIKKFDIFETPINNKMAILRPLYIKKCHILDPPIQQNAFFETLQKIFYHVK